MYDRMSRHMTAGIDNRQLTAGHKYPHMATPPSEVQKASGSGAACFLEERCQERWRRGRKFWRVKIWVGWEGGGTHEEMESL